MADNDTPLGPGQPSYERAISEIGLTHSDAVRISGKLGRTGESVYPPVQLFALNGTSIVPVLSDSLGNLVTFPDEQPVIDWPHEMIHGGYSFSFSEVVTLGSGGVQDYLITVGATLKPHLTYQVEGYYGVTIEMFRGTGLTQSASAETVVNRKESSTNTATTTLKKGHNGGSGDGTRFIWRKSGTGTSSGKLSSNAGDRQERILATTVVYLFRITSLAAANDVSVQFDWYEE